MAGTAFLVGVPIILAISALIGALLDGWSTSKVALLYGAAMTTPVAMAYTFLVTLAERSYCMVFWAREKIREEIREEMKKARSEADAEGVSRRDQEWRAWYERQQAAFREGRPFDEPPPAPPESPNGH